jgi:hypothetical protein
MPYMRAETHVRKGRDDDGTPALDLLDDHLHPVSPSRTERRSEPNVDVGHAVGVAKVGLAGAAADAVDLGLRFVLRC